jgi:hypothetical protein
MAAKRPTRATRARKTVRVARATPARVTRAEFDAVLRLLNERGHIINELRSELHRTAREVRDQAARERAGIAARVTALEREIDAFKRRKT